MENVYQHDPTPLDSEGKCRKVLEQESGLDTSRYKNRLNLGCGTDYIEGWTNLDGDVSIKADAHCELDSKDVKLPFADNAFDYIYASHILEHIFYLPQLKKELLRVLRPGGVFVILVPEARSVDAWGDDTHCRAFTVASFSPGFWGHSQVKICKMFRIAANDTYMAERLWLGAVLEKPLSGKY